MSYRTQNFHTQHGYTDISEFLLNNDIDMISTTSELTHNLSKESETSIP